MLDNQEELELGESKGFIVQETTSDHVFSYGQFTVKRQYGYFALYKRHRRVGIVGPHWWVMCITYLLTCTVTLAVFIVLAKRGTWKEILIGIFLSGLCLMLYSLVACTDPGIAPRHSVPQDDSWRYCGRCENYGPRTTKHCVDCGTCIEELDHHCVWTGKCIGKRNTGYFYMWLLILAVTMVFDIFQFTQMALPPELQPNTHRSSS